MDRALVALILVGILAGAVAGSYALYALLDLSIRALNHLWRIR